VRMWYRLPFVRRRGGPDLAGVREPRRPRPPVRPPMAQSAEPEDDRSWASSPVTTLDRPARHWWWRRDPRAGHT